MNDERRKKLATATRDLDNAKSVIEEVKGEEEESYENMPEGMQGGDKGEKAQAAIDALDEAINACDSALEYISTATE